MDQSNEIKKKFFSISEVAKMFGVNASLIRFWESEFSILKPQKNAKGERRFVQKDIEDLKLIYYLVKTKGFTLEGAKESIRQKADVEEIRQKMQVIDSLKEIKGFLENLRDNLTDTPNS